MRSSWSAFSCPWQQGCCLEMSEKEKLHQPHKSQTCGNDTDGHGQPDGTRPRSSAPQLEDKHLDVVAMVTSSWPPLVHPQAFLMGDETNELKRAWSDSERTTGWDKKCICEGGCGFERSQRILVCWPVALVLITLPLSWLCWPLTPLTPYHSNQIANMPLNEIIF